MVDRDELRGRMASLSDEALLDIVGPERETYLPEAIVVAEAELASRSMDPSQAPEPDASTEDSEEAEEVLEGTGGWLGFLVGVSLGLAPLFALVLGWQALAGPSLIAAGYAVIMALTFYWMGLGLNYGWPRAVQASIKVLAFHAILNVVAGLATGDVAGAAFGPVIPVAWILYLRRSRRVYNTYPGWREYIKESGDAGLRARWLSDRGDGGRERAALDREVNGS